jgi:hypothetical protein
MLIPADVGSYCVEPSLLLCNQVNPAFPMILEQSEEIDWGRLLNLFEAFTLSDLSSAITKIKIKGREHHYDKNMPSS